MSYSESRSSSWRPSRAHDRPTSLCPRSRLSASYCTVPPVRALSLSQRRSRSCGPWSWYSFPVALLLLLPNRGRFPRSRCAARCCRQRIARCARRVLGQHVIQAADCRVLSGSDGYNSTASWTFTHPNQASIEPPCQPTTAPISSMKAGGHVLPSADDVSELRRHRRTTLLSIRDTACVVCAPRTRASSPSLSSAPSSAGTASSSGRWASNDSPTDYFDPPAMGTQNEQGLDGDSGRGEEKHGAGWRRGEW